MYTSGDINARNIIKIRSLLKNCITLLETKDRPDISLLANCLLIELYADADRENEKEDESDSEVIEKWIVTHHYWQHTNDDVKNNSLLLNFKECKIFIDSRLKLFNATLPEKSEAVVI